MESFALLHTRGIWLFIGICLLAQSNWGFAGATTETLTLSGEATQTPGTLAATSSVQKLKVSGHYLTKEDGTPFFLLQDTAWALPKLSPTDIDTYINDRATKNFTSILIALKYHTDILFKGHGPFLNNNTDTPDSAFWGNVDYIVTKAASKGLYVSITMMWTEDYQSLGLTSDPDKAYRMGHWIGDRYKNQNNIIWVLSGEYNYGDWPKVYDKVAQGLKDGDLGGHLLTIHPGSRPDGSSSADYQKSSWLNFNLLQSGAYIDNHAHENFREGYDLVTRDWNLSPIKPVMDGECAYEDLPDGWSYTHDDTAPLIGSDTIRRKAYWSVFAGACGHTYGDANIEMINTGENRYGARKPWQAGLSDPGSRQMQHLRNLIEAHSFLNRIPDQWLIVSGMGSGLNHVRATKASDGSYALIYIPRGTTIKIDLTKIAKPRVNASWFNPRDGSRSAIGNYAATGSQSFTPPGTVSNGNDWVLVLEGTSSNPTPTPTATPTPTPASTPSGLSFLSTSGDIDSPFAINSDNTISQPVLTVEPTQGGKASYSFNVPALASYTISAEVNCPDGGSNSFFINIDGDPTTTMVWSIPVTSGLQARPVIWASESIPHVWTLPAGVHQLVVRGREAGSKLGQISIVPPPAPPQGLHVVGP